MRPEHFILVVIVALISLLGASCASTTETATGDDFVRYTPPSDEPAPTLPSSDDSPVTTKAPAKQQSPASTVTTPDSTPPPTAVPAAVLAVALERSEGLSYSFEQGFGMYMNMGGFEMTIAPESPYVRGEVQGDRMHMTADVGVIFAETFASLGVDQNDPDFAGVSALFDDVSFEIWTDGDVMTLDMAAFVAAMENIDPGTARTFPTALAQGPVTIDLSKIDGIDPTTLAAQLGQGSQTVDPAKLAEALRSVDSVVKVGTDVVDGQPVTVYSGVLSMEDYAAALGEDVDSQLGALEQLGMSPDETALAESLLPALESIDVRTTVMVDDDDLVRRLEMHIDMAPMFAALFSDPDLLAMGGAGSQEMADGFDALFAELEMTMDIWQEYDDYGASFDIDAPAGTDVTASFDDVFSDLVQA